MEKGYSKNYWLKEIAFSFGMNIGQFAETIGYKRQTLYCAAGGTCKLNRGHVGVAIEKLTALSLKILEAEIHSAQESHEHRCKMLDDFAKRVTAEDE